VFLPLESCDGWKDPASIDNVLLQRHSQHKSTPDRAFLTKASPAIVSTMTPAAQFGRRLREIRKAQKLKIGQLAEKADTGVKHLGRIERGEKQPSFELIIALASAMNVSPAKFFEFDSQAMDPKLLRKQLDQFLARRDARQLQQIQQILMTFFDS